MGVRLVAEKGGWAKWHQMSPNARLGGGCVDGSGGVWTIRRHVRPVAPGDSGATSPDKGEPMEHRDIVEIRQLMAL